MNITTFPYESKNTNLTLSQRFRARKEENKHELIYSFFHRVREHVEFMITRDSIDTMYLDYHLFDRIVSEKTNKPHIFEILTNVLREQGVEIVFEPKRMIKIVIL